MTVFTSGPITVRVRPPHQIAAKTFGLQPYSWGNPLLLPWLQTQTSRAHPLSSGADFPDRAANEGGPSSQMWIWANKLLWDPTTRCMLGIGSPANATNYFQSTTLWRYNSVNNLYQVYESPLAALPVDPLAPQSNEFPGSVGHLFDNNCIALGTRRLLIKQTLPKSLGQILRTLSAVDTVNDTISYGSYTGTDITVQFKIGAGGNGTLPAPLQSGVNYYLIKLSNTQARVASSFANAQLGVYLDLTTVGAGPANRNMEVQDAAGFVQPQVMALNLDAITDVRSSAEYGAALAGNLGRPSDGGPDPLNSQALNCTAPALDYMPNMGPYGTLVMYNKDHYWFYEFSAPTGIAGSWSAYFAIPGMTVGNAIHNVGHRNPLTDRFVFGGGSLDSSGAHNRQFFMLDNDRNLIVCDTPPNDPVTGLPIIVSVNNGAAETQTRATFTYAPGSAESIVFHDNGFIYAINTVTGAWRTIGANTSDPVDIVCSVPSGVTGTTRGFGAILCGYSDVASPAGSARLRPYRAA